MKLRRDTRKCHGCISGKVTSLVASEERRILISSASSYNCTKGIVVYRGFRDRSGSTAPERETPGVEKSPKNISEWTAIPTLESACATCLRSGPEIFILSQAGCSLGSYEQDSIDDKVGVYERWDERQPNSVPGGHSLSQQDTKRAQ